MSKLSLLDNGLPLPLFKRALPSVATGWQPLPSWKITLYRFDGFADRKNIIGTYEDAVAERTVAMRTGRYYKSWIEMEKGS